MRHQKGRTLGVFLALKCLKTFVLYVALKRPDFGHFSALKCLKTFALYLASKRPDLGRIFGLETSKNLCFICGITKAGLWTFFRP